MSDDTHRAARTYRQVRYVRPSGSTEIYLVRHGESAPADPERPFALVDGRGDPRLSEDGIEQAERVAERLSTLEPCAIYVTDLQRTSQTAEPLARRLGLTPIVEAGLTEVHMGAWEGGLYREKIATSDPLLLRLFSEQRWDVIPGGESNESLFSRTTTAITRIATAHPDERVVVFAHAVSISAVLSRATNSSPFAFITHDNAAISEIVVNDEVWSLRAFNDRAHLG